MYLASRLQIHKHEIVLLDNAEKTCCIHLGFEGEYSSPASSAVCTGFNI